jgi:acyl-CoA thioesterase I
MFLSSLLVALVSATAVVSASQAASAPKPRIVAFGDSLTSGQGIGAARAYPALLQQTIDDAGLDYTVVNAGVAGDTSDRALRRFERALEGDVRILIVALGANDGLRGVPVARLKENLSRIIETAQARDIAVLLCGMETLPIHGWDYTVAFHNTYRDLAAQYSVPLVPFILFNVIGNPELMQPDRAHPSAAGQRAIAEKIWPFLERIIRSEALASAPRVPRAGRG